MTNETFTAVYDILKKAERDYEKKNDEKIYATNPLCSILLSAVKDCLDLMGEMEDEYSLPDDDDPKFKPKYIDDSFISD